MSNSVTCISSSFSEFQISLKIPFFSLGISCEAAGVLGKIYSQFAWQMGDSAYSEATDDPRIKSDFAAIARGLGISKRKFKILLKEIEHFMLIDDEYLRPKHKDWLCISRLPSRKNLTLDVRAEVRVKSGNMCVYCGCNEGPFHNDHLFPISKGGTDTPSNIVLACASCNLSKSDRTLREWMEVSHV